MKGCAAFAMAYAHAPSMSGRGSVSRRRPSGGRASSGSTHRANIAKDPILDDDDVDTTDITTYFSCRNCFNSIMLRPIQLGKEPLKIKCNVCDMLSYVTLNMLENVDGSPFDPAQWTHGNTIADQDDNDS